MKDKVQVEIDVGRELSAEDVGANSSPANTRKN